MANGELTTTSRELTPRKGTKAQEEAMKGMESLLNGLDDKYGAILPSGSGRDGRLTLPDFRSHAPVSFRLSDVPSQIEANRIVTDLKAELGKLMLQYDPNSKGIEYFTQSGKSSYDPKTKELTFSLVLNIDEVALKQAWQGTRLAQK